MKHLFGTDGIRGKANSGNMTANLALKLGMAVGHLFTKGEHKHKVVIGKDTRLSGYLLESALTAGLISVGMDVVLVGPMPTPAVAMLTRSLRADLGVMISASHNPYQDNGIKLFGPDGYKLSDEMELEVERIVFSDNINDLLAESSALGKASRLADAAGRYIEFVKNTFPRGSRLDGLKIVIDAANGAAYNLGGSILYELGADIVQIGVSPNGLNINLNCGSSHPEALQAAVIQHKADIGIALDGDADRLIIVDENGAVIDGDYILALIATYYKSHNLLKNNGVVATVMSNLGLEKYLETMNLKLHRTAVGDRYVSERMKELSINLGGEQSGHIILSNYTTTGDGLIAALHVLAMLVEKKIKASEISKLFERFPQILRNIKYTQGKNPLEAENVQKCIKQAEDKLNGNGRLVIRKSGTEPLIRIMAEGDKEEELHNILDDIETEIKKVINA